MKIDLRMCFTLNLALLSEQHSPQGHDDDDVDHDERFHFS